MFGVVRSVKMMAQNTLFVNGESIVKNYWEEIFFRLLGILYRDVIK